MSRYRKSGCSSASKLASMPSSACASSPVPASSTSWPAENESRTAVLRSATRATRLTASANGAAESSATAFTCLGSSDSYRGKSPPSSRVVVRRPPPSNPIIPSPPAPSSPGSASAMDTSAPAVSARAVSASARAGTSTAADRSGRAGVQRSSRTASRERSGRWGAGGGAARAGDGEPVAVGGDQGESLALDLDPDAGQRGERVVPAGRGGRLAYRGRERVTPDGARRRGHLRQGRVVLGRHGQQGERRAATGERGPRAVGDDLHRAGGQAPGDLREQAAGDQGLAFLLRLDRHPGLRRDVIVEAGQGQVPGCLQADSRQDRDGGPGRQGTGRPRHGFSQYIAFYLDLHRKLPPRLEIFCSGSGTGLELPTSWVSVPATGSEGLRQARWRERPGTCLVRCCFH